MKYGIKTKTECGRYSAGSDWPFWLLIILIAAFYSILIIGMLLADMQYAVPSDIYLSLSKPEIRYAALQPASGVLKTG